MAGCAALHPPYELIPGFYGFSGAARQRALAARRWRCWSDAAILNRCLQDGRGMVAKVRTVAFHGVEVIEVETQVTIASGLPAFTVVGLPDKAVAESRERVRSALQSLGLALPPKRITVNLAPADVLKEGSHFDLPIALAL